jgi:RHS repeat-associated protein
MCAPLPAELLINGLGQRVKKTVGSTVTLYHYDEGGKLLVEYNSTGAAAYETIYLDDQPVAVIKPGSTATTYKAYYVYADHINTPRLITDNATGTANKKVWQWDSDPFGASVPNENPAGAGTFTYNQRFPGQVYDKETGLHYNYFRDYNPATGRYVQSDPIGLAGGINTYGYVGGNPVSFRDSFGLKGGDQPSQSLCLALGNNPASCQQIPQYFPPTPPLPSVDDPCVQKYLSDNYGDVLSFVANLGNLQMLFPSANPDWWATDKEAASVVGEKTAATKGVKLVGTTITKVAPGSAVGAGLATVGGLASGVVEVAGAFMTPFGTAAMAKAREACNCHN